MIIEVLGSGCIKCMNLIENVQEAVGELNIGAEVVKVTDINKIIAYGVMITPALVIDGKVVSSGKVLNKEEIKKIIGQK